MREINALCQIKSKQPLIDDAVESFKKSKRVQFEHFIRAPAALTINVRNVVETGHFTLKTLFKNKLLQ